LSPSLPGTKRGDGVWLFSLDGASLPKAEAVSGAAEDTVLEH